MTSPAQQQVPGASSDASHQSTRESDAQVFPGSSSALDSIAAVASAASPLTVPGPLPPDPTSAVATSEVKGEALPTRSSPRKRTFSEVGGTAATRSLRPRRSTTTKNDARTLRQDDSNMTAGSSSSSAAAAAAGLRQEANGSGDVVSGIDEQQQQLRLKRYVCPHEDCGKSYLGMKELQRHQLNHEPPQFKCKYCGREWHR